MQMYNSSNALSQTLASPFCYLLHAGFAFQNQMNMLIFSKAGKPHNKRLFSVERHFSLLISFSLFRLAAADVRRTIKELVQSERSAH